MITVLDIVQSFSLDKWSGKKCYMVSARDLVIVWAETPNYWKWISVPESRSVNFFLFDSYLICIVGCF